MATQKFDLFDGLVYETGNVPAVKSIRGSHLKIKDQVWYRHEEYTQWEWNDDPKQGALWWESPEEGQMEWYYAEIDRILNGEWVMINGVPTFFNHFCYFFLQWFRTKEGLYPYYKDVCLDFFRFMEVVFKDPKCRGANVMKGRRVGVSSMCMSIMLQFGLIKQNTEQGITSKSSVDAEKIFKLMLVNAYSRLPNFLKPRIAGNDMPVKTMHITKQAGRITKDKAYGSEKEGLNNKIEWRAPGGNVFDGDGLWVLLIDEAAKYEDMDVGAYLEIAMQIIHAGKQIGRIIMITTVNRGDKGGDNYKPTWYAADYRRLNELGQTENKLYRLFIPGFRGGRDGGWIDKYGNSVVDTPTPEQTEWLKNDPNTLDPYIGCKAYCEMQRRMKEKDDEKLMEEIRMFPFNPEEVFKGANNRCNFRPIEELHKQITLIEDECRKLGQAENGRRGRFKKHDSGEKYFVDDPQGMWYVLEFLEQNNKSVYNGSIKCPDNTMFGCGGLDPIANSKSTVDPGSDACLIIHKRYNALEPEKSNYPCAMLIGRPTIKEDFYDQVYWGLEYFGVKMLAERAPTDWEDLAIKRKLAAPLDAFRYMGYLVATKRSNGSEVYGINPQDKEAREQHLTEMIEYAYHNMHKIKFLRLLRDMLKFDIDERTDYDACMAWGYALMGLKEWKSTEKQEAKILKFMELRKSKKYY